MERSSGSFNSTTVGSLRDKGDAGASEKSDSTVFITDSIKRTEPTDVQTAINAVRHAHSNQHFRFMMSEHVAIGNFLRILVLSKV